MKYYLNVILLTTNLVAGGPWGIRNIPVNNREDAVQRSEILRTGILSNVAAEYQFETHRHYGDGASCGVEVLENVAGTPAAGDWVSVRDVGAYDRGDNEAVVVCSLARATGTW